MPLPSFLHFPIHTPVPPKSILNSVKLSVQVQLLLEILLHQVSPDRVSALTSKPIGYLLKRCSVI